MSPWTRCPAQLPAVSWTLAHWRDHKPQVRALSVRFLSVSIDFSRCSSHWYVILFNHMTYLDIISKYLHNCITKICVYIYIYRLFSNSYQYHNACVKLPALLCCGHGHVSSSSLLQRTASTGRTFVLGVKDTASLTSLDGDQQTSVTGHTISVTGSEWHPSGIGWQSQSAKRGKRAKPSAAERLPLPPLQWHAKWSPPALRYQISNIRTHDQRIIE